MNNTDNNYCVTCSHYKVCGKTSLYVDLTERLPVPANGDGFKITITCEDYLKHQPTVRTISEPSVKTTMYPTLY